MFKGIVHLKKKKNSSFTHPHAVPNLYMFLSYDEQKKLLLVPTDFHSRERNTMEVNGDYQLFDYQHSSKYLILCST